jgi:hypothetical protein
MSRLGGAIDGVIGVDPHRDTLAAAVTDAVGGLLAQTCHRGAATAHRPGGQLRPDSSRDRAYLRQPKRHRGAIRGGGRPRRLRTVL